MRHRLTPPGSFLILAAWLTTAACSASAGRFAVPESPLVLSEDPPPLPQPPPDSPYGSAESTWVTVHLRSGVEMVTLTGWCRVGVWTTLARQSGRDFIVREAWGRLGERKPRLLLRVRDQAIEGVLARLRPNEDGTTDFIVELAEARILPGEPLDNYHGQVVQLARPRRHGYRFQGRAPPGWVGAVAHWEPGVAVYLGEFTPDPHQADAQPPEPVARFRNARERGFVVGPRPAVEVFVEEWRPARPVPVVADGVERKDYRLEHVRLAAGFHSGEDGERVTYGSEFEFPERTDG